MTSFVIDASVLGAMLLQEVDPRVAPTARALETDGAIAPILLFFELRNLLLVSERRGRVTARQADDYLDLASELPLKFAPLPDPESLLTLARKRKLTVYDAAYLELAVRERLPLATLDRALEAAARAEGVDLVGA